jgi:hypothetical protein
MATIRAYVDRGWRPIPLHFIQPSGRCSCPAGADCGSPGKHPAFASWTEPVIINDRWYAWWAAHPAPGVGLVTGSVGGFWVLDVDPRHGGDVYLAELEVEHGALPGTITHRTRSGGYHLLFELPDDREITNSRGGLDPARGLDVRGNGGQIAAPPTPGYSGPTRKVLLAQAPGWLLELVAPDRPVPGGIGTGSRPSRAPEVECSGASDGGDWTDQELAVLAGTILERELAWLLESGAGDRNEALNKAVFACATLIGCQGVPDDWETVIWEQMGNAADAIGLGAVEATKTIKSGIRGGKAKPRTPDHEVEAYSWPPARKAKAPGISEFSLETEKSGTEVSGTADEGYTGKRGRDGRIYINVSNLAHASEFVREELGQRGLSGVFRRGDLLVHTPRVGEEGYITPGEGDDDGPAQVRPLEVRDLKARIEVRYNPGKNKEKAGEKEEEVEGENGEIEVRTVRTAAKGWVPSLLPLQVAQHAWDAGRSGEGAKGLRPLTGVTHTPVMRADGSVLWTPGYDPDSRLLYLPDKGMTVAEVPDEPTVLDVKRAVELLLEPIAEFPFVAEHHRANWLGMAFTPLLRPMLPPPYQLGVIEAPSPGSGKGYLAGMLRTLHGGALRSELPLEAEELRKSITAILLDTTSPVITFDNVRGTIRSSVLEGLLTAAMWDDRYLGYSKEIHVPNDRLWTITGNNALIGGDLARRCLWVTIDPRMPHPESRVFKLNPARWMAQHRGEYLAALLTVARGWVAAGAPRGVPGRSDDYGDWYAALRGLLEWAGIEGTFGADPMGEAGEADRHRAESSDDLDWADFLVELERVFGEKAFTVKQITERIGERLDGRPAIDPAVLPGDLAEKWGRAGTASFTRTLGHWLSNRVGRYAASTTLEKFDAPAPGDNHRIKAHYRLRRYNT